jgi:hypothetical protein
VILLGYASLLLPGLAWWFWLGRRREDPLVSLAQVIAVSLAIITLLASAGFFLGTRFPPMIMAVLVILFALLLVDGLLRKGFWLPRRYRLHLVLGLPLLGLAMAWRLYQARNLLLPNWVDSQHHFLIIQAILDGGAIPHDLSPYLEMPFYYHFGYHAVTALFTSVSGVSIGNAMLSLGQVLNAVVGLSVYALGKSLWRNWRPALVAALLVSFATRMPAYYLSWGRYSLTVGLVILPVAMALALDLLRGKTQWKSGLTLSLLTAGLLLSHYFAALLLAIFLVLAALIHLAQNSRCLPQAFIRLSWLLNSSAFGLLLAAPWLWRVAQYSRSSAGIDAHLPANISAIFTSELWRYIWQLLGPTSNYWLLIPAGVGLVFALFKRHSLAFTLWSLVLVLFSLPWGVTFPPFRADHFAIILFLPVTLLVGWITWLAAQQVGRRLKQRWVTSLILALVVLGWTAWGFTDLKNIVNPVTVLVTKADLDALEWVTENTPPEARFYISTTHWLGNLYRGVDGGGWLLPYTGRWALVPTVFYGFSPDTAWVNELRGWGEAASQIITCDAEFWNLVEEANLDWIYLREGVGQLQPAGLQGCQNILVVYSNEGVWIYQIRKN